MKITVKRRPRATGRAGWFTGPQTADIRVDGEDVGVVAHSGAKQGWYFYVQSARYSLKRYDSGTIPNATYEEAKKIAVAYVKKHGKLSPMFRVEVPIAGVFGSSFYAADEEEARARAVEAAERTLKQHLMRSDMAWEELGAPRVQRMESKR